MMASLGSTRTLMEKNGFTEKRKCTLDRLVLKNLANIIVARSFGEHIHDVTLQRLCSENALNFLLSRLELISLIFNVKLGFILTIEIFYFEISDEIVLDFDYCSFSLGPKCIICGRYGEYILAPILSFTSCNLPDKLLHNIEAARYDMPTPVQMQAIPAALMGKSMLVLADTGSGKSASFLISIISRCASFRLAHPSDKKKPLAMVLTPTRELSIQVEEHAKLLGKGLPFKTALVVGGDAMARQLYRIQQGVELIVGTPGRLVDLLTKHEIDLDDMMIFVVDEVDCMLQRGFREQVMQIYRAMPQPQVLMYSATISHELEKMANSLAKGTVVISVGEPNKPNNAVKQLAIWVESKQKKQKLFDILVSKQHFKPPVIVYVGSRLGADLLANAITVTTGIKALSIHGEKSMKERREIMGSFLVGEVPVVVATGVLGRGVDLLGVRQVIVFDMPNSIKEYVHQIGRASRMGEEGQAIIFVNEENKNVFAELIEVLKSTGAAVPRELVNSPYAKGFFSVGNAPRKRKNRP
ncbi:DEAD-box ATP-dependent RNA helicase 41 isoform X2 [Senna tora]|uniref:RNA helicase n=1 Tax=Senna tora TaxID=362788 RepID=A0A834VYE2_9FABA|nr:DEAD-box ATP-dependent RNA helicase 41 isoform X2 [Senna tora]